MFFFQYFKDAVPLASHFLCFWQEVCLIFVVVHFSWLFLGFPLSQVLGNSIMMSFVCLCGCRFFFFFFFGDCFVSLDLQIVKFGSFFPSKLILKQYDFLHKFCYCFWVLLYKHVLDIVLVLFLNKHENASIIWCRIRLFFSPWKKPSFLLIQIILKTVLYHYVKRYCHCAILSGGSLL